jgi:hypothetical protein
MYMLDNKKFNSPIVFSNFKQDSILNIKSIDKCDNNEIKVGSTVYGCYTAFNT